MAAGMAWATHTHLTSCAASRRSVIRFAGRRVRDNHWVSLICLVGGDCFSSCQLRVQKAIHQILIEVRAHADMFQPP